MICLRSYDMKDYRYQKCSEISFFNFKHSSNKSLFFILNFRCKKRKNNPVCNCTMKNEWNDFNEWKSWESEMNNFKKKKTKF